MSLFQKYLKPTVQSCRLIFSCPHSPQCTACDPTVQGIEDHRKHWLGLLGSAQFEVPSALPFFDSPDPHLRCKMDFSIQGLARGLWSRETGGILDLPTCELLLPELQEFYSEFRSIPLSFAHKASFRLRISPEGHRGLWLDLAHEDTKTFLSSTEVGSLRELVGALGHIEVGQRLKSLRILESSGAKLVKPELFPWFETEIESVYEKILCYVGSFTQPSFESHRWMLTQLRHWLEEIRPTKAFEFGCGIGNWSLFLLNYVRQLDVTESEQRSLEALTKNLEAFDLSNSCRVLPSRFYHHAEKLDEDYDLIFLNPSRSGVGQLLEGPSINARWIIYISCFPETLIQDMQPLRGRYKLQSHALVNQFPGSRHFEVLSLWKKGL